MKDTGFTFDTLYFGM